MHPSLALRGNRSSQHQALRQKPRVSSTCLSPCDLDHMKWVFPSGRIPWFWATTGSHVQQAKRYHVGRSWHQTQQFLKLLTVSDWPSFTLLTDVRIDLIRAGDIRACIVVGSPPHPDKWFSVLKKHTFLTLSLNPNSFKWVKTTSRCRTAIRSDELIRARVQGRRQEPDIDTLCPQSRSQGLPVMGKEYAFSRSIVTTSPRIWCETWPAWRELSELQSYDWAVQLT